MTKLQVPKTREKFVVDMLREAILTGEIAPGDKLDENELAHTLDVSRTPVRSALRVLATEGLVTIHPHRGCEVIELTVKAFEELFLIRGNLEGLAARFAAPAMDDDRIAALRVIHLECDEATNAQEWMDANLRFHSTIYEAADLPHLLSIIASLRNSAVPYCRQFIVSAEHAKESQRDHLRILRACEDRDGLRAEREIQEHLKFGCRGMVRELGTILLNVEG